MCSCRSVREIPAPHQPSFLRVAGRDSSEDAAYWESLAEAIPEVKLKLWDTLHDALQKHQWVAHTLTQTQNKHPRWPHRLIFSALCSQRCPDTEVRAHHRDTGPQAAEDGAADAASGRPHRKSASECFFSHLFTCISCMHPTIFHVFSSRDEDNSWLQNMQ